MLRTVAAIAVFATLGSCQSATERLEGDGLTVLEGATLIDGTGSVPRPETVVVVQGSKILRVGPMGSFAYPPDTKVLDVTDKWIVPGFVDTHAHMPAPEDEAVILKTLVAFGITSVRNPGAVPSAVELRARIERGEIVGPRLVTAGNLIDAPGGIFSGDPGTTEVRTEQEVRAEIQRQVDDGVDWIKLYRGLPPALVEVAVDEAHRLRRPVLGHLGNTTWSEAARLGIDGLSHFGIFGTPWELVPEEDRAEVQRVCRERDSSAGFLKLRSTVSAAAEETHEWARLLASKQVSVEPNLVLLRAVLWGNDAEVLETMEPQYAPASWRGGFWFDAMPHPYSGASKSEWVEEAQATYPLFEQLVSVLHDEGVVLTVGSDLMNPWMTPGVSYHRELELFVAAGIEPADVLVAATRAGAEALGLEEETGTVEQGKVADLVILGSNPIAEIRNTRTIESIFLRGVQYLPSDLGVHE